MKLVPGNVYKRTDIHDAFGGQRQGGISTPSNRDVILIFSSESGHSFGYQDGWTEDGDFFYTGEGQVGDMEFIRGNQAIRDHEINSKKLLLFLYERQAHVRFEGEVRCVDYDFFRTTDREGKNRKGIRFNLEIIKKDLDATKPDTVSLSSYRKPNKTARNGLVTSRVGQGYYRQEIIKKFNGKCAVTGTDLNEILIASHIVPWQMSSDEEKLDADNGILLSPNYDALFDKHLISFDDDGLIIISDRLMNEDVDNLGINRLAQINVTEGMKKYLSRHRDKLK